MDINFSYYKCQTCHAKVNCGVCEKDLLERLGEIPGIIRAEMVILKNQLTLETSLDEDSVEEVLEDCGLFVC